MYTQKPSIPSIDTESLHTESLRNKPARASRIGLSARLGTKFPLGLVAFLCGILFILPAQSAITNVNSLLWDHAIGQGGNDESFALKVDNSGNVISTGFFDGDEISFGNDQVLLTSKQKDIFVVKYDSNGAPLWARSMGGPNIDEGRGLAIDNQNDIFISGNYRSGASEAAQFDAESFTAVGQDDIFVTKYSADGSYVWTWTAGGTFIDSSWDVAVDNNSDVYATGYFSGSVNFGNSAASTITSTVGTNDIFVVGLNNDGSFKWINYVAGESGDRGNGIAVDGDRGFVYTTGFIQSDSDFNPRGDGAPLSVNPNARDIFLSKYNSDTGAHIQTIFMGDNGRRDFGQAIAVDESTGFVYLTGAFDGSADFNPAGGNTLVAQGTSDAFVAVYNSGLEHQWSVGFGGPGEDVGEAIALGRSDGSNVSNVYVAGRFEETADFNPDPNDTFERTTAGDEDIFVVNLTNTGEFATVATVGGPQEDQGLGVGVDANQNVSYAGYFSGSMDVDPTTSVLNRTGAGGQDIIISSLSSNVSPVADSQSVNTDEDQAIEIILTGSDPAGESVTISATGAEPQNGTLSGINATGSITASVTYTPTANFAGSDSFSFLVTDASGFTAVADVTITVAPVNDAPTVSNELTYNGNEDAPLNVPAESGLIATGASDPDDGDTLSASTNDSTSAQGATITVAADGSFTYDPTGVAALQALPEGGMVSDSFSFTVSDLAGITATATTTVAVEGRNDAPVANDDNGFTTPASSPLNATTSVLGNDTDVDTGDTLSVETTPVTLPTGGSVQLEADGTFVYTPNAGFAGADTFEYRVVDGQGGDDTATVTIAVGSVNVPPQLSGSTVEVKINEVLNGSSLLDGATDPNNDPLVIESTPFVTPESGAVIINADGTFVYTPNADFEGTDAFTYRICDQGVPVLCSEATVTITVTAPDQPPTGSAVAAVDDTVTIQANTSKTIDVLANDSTTDNSGLTIKTTGSPDQGGTVSINAENKILYIPADGFAGTETFTYIAVDGTGTEATATVVVTVTEVVTDSQMQLFLPLTTN